MVKMLIVLVSTVSNSQVFLFKKMYSHFFSTNIRISAIFNDQSFNGTLTNDIVSFEHLGPEFLLFLYASKTRFWIDCLQSIQSIRIHQNFLKVFVKVIIIDQWNQTARFLYEI